MDEKLEGTPNPINAPEVPTDTQESEPLPAEQPVVPIEVNDSTAEPVESVTPTEGPVESAETPVVTSEPAEIPVAAPAPEPVVITDAPAPAAAANGGKKKSKAGIIIAIICILLAIGGGIAYAFASGLISFGPKGTVDSALVKLQRTGLPEYVSVNGTISAKSKSASFEASANIEATINTKTLENYAKANISAPNLEEYVGFDTSDITIDEIYESNDFYVKISGIDDLEEVTESLADWIHIPGSTLPNLTAEAGTYTGCMADITNNDTKTEINELVNKYPFVIASTDNLEIAKKKDNLYRITVDWNNLADFINGVSTANFINNYADCMGASMQAPTQKISGDLLKAYYNMLGVDIQVYVEVDGDNNFTRFVAKISNDDAEVTIDFSFAYPSSIQIAEPEEYVELENLIQELNELDFTDIDSYDSDSLFDIDIESDDYDLDDYDLDDYDVDEMLEMLENLDMDDAESLRSYYSF